MKRLAKRFKMRGILANSDMASKLTAKASQFCQK
jgi:hypothetical protein